LQKKKIGGEDTLSDDDLAERVYVPDKTSLNMNGAGQPGQPLLGVFQISRTVPTYPHFLYGLRLDVRDAYSFVW
jgi:hypothetical protein